jgi:hypothetical protein
MKESTLAMEVCVPLISMLCTEIVHVSGHGEAKTGSVARVGRLLGDFVDKPNAREHRQAC